MSARERTAWIIILFLWIAGIGAAGQFAKFSIAFDDLVAFYGADPAVIGAALSIVGSIELVFGVSAGV